MRAGRLNKRVVIEKPTESRENHETVKTWSEFATRWASIEFLSAGERFSSDQEVGEVSHRLRMRYLPGARAKMRALVRSGSTTLAQTMTASGTTAVVDSADPFPADAPYFAQIEDELIKITAGFGTTSWTVTRAQGGTTGVVHGAGEPIHLAVVYDIEGVGHQRNAETVMLCREREPGYGV